MGLVYKKWQWSCTDPGLLPRIAGGMFIVKRSLGNLYNERDSFEKTVKNITKRYSGSSRDVGKEK